MDFTGLHLDIALRHLYQEVSPPASEAQKIEKMIEVFARRYIICNQMFASGFRYGYFLFLFLVLYYFFLYIAHPANFFSKSAYF